jgi:hypothetical protein
MSTLRRQRLLQELDQEDMEDYRAVLATASQVFINALTAIAKVLLYN